MLFFHNFLGGKISKGGFTREGTSRPQWKNPHVYFQSSQTKVKHFPEQRQIKKLLFFFSIRQLTKLSELVNSQKIPFFDLHGFIDQVNYNKIVYIYNKNISRSENTKTEWMSMFSNRNYWIAHLKSVGLPPIDSAIFY